jgi:hypothetical protein
MDGFIAGCLVAGIGLFATGVLAVLLKSEGFGLGATLSIIQTFFSIFALAAALGVAWSEYRRAKFAEGRRRRDFTKVARMLAAQAVVALERFVATPTPTLNDIIQEYRKATDVVGAVNDALKTVRDTAPPDATLVLAMRELIIVTEPHRFTAGLARPALDDHFRMRISEIVNCAKRVA